MEVIWSLENVKKCKKCYTKLQILLLISSISLWKKYHPLHFTVLYCDNITYKFLSNLEIFHLWDDIRILEYVEEIDRSKFWSSSKTKIISETKIPLLIIDHDFLVFKNIDKYLNNNVIYSYDEIINNWYPPEHNKYNQQLSIPVDYIVDLAANVSLLYLPDPVFARKYGKQVLKNHIEFTKMNSIEITTNHMILSEQLMLKQWLTRDNIIHNTLSKNLWDCINIKFTNKNNEIGFYNMKESSLTYKHYGVEERSINANKNSHLYKDTIYYLYRCINASKRININNLKNNINLKFNK